MDDRPYVLIARDKDTCVRSRMDAAHELGHLVLHHSLKPKALNNSADFKEIERQAFDFAGAFLMPAESFSAEIWSPSLNAFVALKEHWKASVGAMIMRCAKLDILSEEHQRRLWKYYSARGWLFDEGHHNVAPTWTILKDKFPSARIVNFSATPLRADGQFMAGRILYSYPVFRAIQEGYVKRLKAVVLNPRTLCYVRREGGQEIEVSLDEVRRLGAQLRALPPDR